jgi:hypothetical protein
MADFERGRGNNGNFCSHGIYSLLSRQWRPPVTASSIASSHRLSTMRRMVLCMAMGKGSPVGKLSKGKKFCFRQIFLTGILTSQWCFHSLQRTTHQDTLPSSDHGVHSHSQASHQAVTLNPCPRCRQVTICSTTVMIVSLHNNAPAASQV